MPVIRVSGVTRKFRRHGARRSGTLKAYLLGRWRRGRAADPLAGPASDPASTPAPEYTWALHDVSFTVERGATLGIIGRNGSGKSTLLKVIGGILKPDAGEVTVEGNASTLIELGAGFHPDLTGRENVLVNGLILGLTKREIRERFAAIVDFAELAEYIDEPVRTYSTGMYMRLGFSVAMHTNPDIVLIDEGLAVGDLAFVRKCIDRLNRFKKEGKTIVVVTHEMNTVKHWCDQGIWLHEGRVMAAGEPDDVVDAYTRFLA